MLHLSGPIQIGGCLSRKTCKETPGDTVYSGVLALVLKYLTSKTCFCQQPLPCSVCKKVVERHNFLVSRAHRPLWLNVSLRDLGSSGVQMNFISVN